METPNQLKRKLEEIEKSSSSQETSPAPQSTLLLYPKTKLRPGQFAKYFNQCFKSNDLDGLKNSFNAFKLTKDDLESFFSTERGRSFLTMSLEVSSSEDRFSFLVKFVSSVSLDILKKELQKNDYELLHGFISIESSMENRSASNQTEREEDNNSQIEKFKLLLEIDEAGVQQVFQTHEPQKEITNLMRENFETALNARTKNENIITATNKTSGPSDVK